MATVTYPWDYSGNNPTNLIQNEIHTVSESVYKDYNFIIPEFGPFFVDNFQLVLVEGTNSRPLVEDVDFSFALSYVTGTRVTGKVMYGAVTLHNLSMDGILKMTYQTLGGTSVADRLQVLTTLADKAYNPRITIWELVTNVPGALPPTPHYQDYDQFYGQETLVHALAQIKDAIITSSGMTATQFADFFAMLDAGNLSSYLKRAGDSMEGALVLNKPATEAKHAVTKEYVDNIFQNNSTLTQLLSAYVSLQTFTDAMANTVKKSGSSMTGNLSLNMTPSADEHAVHKKYVDDKFATLTAQVTAMNAQVTSLNNNPVTQEYVDNKIAEAISGTAFFYVQKT